MRVEKLDKKWIIKGEGDGWVFNRKFPRKWKAETALRLFREGRSLQDYWDEVRYSSGAVREPTKALESVKKALSEILSLNPTIEEVVAYAEKMEGIHGVVTFTEGNDFFGPSLHNTWQIKTGGRVHIDIGAEGYHLMLNKKYSRDFIEFIKSRRGEM
ncbi:hypothetical protein Thermo_01649 [Thermoplasmatales archaeon]|nr:hypothetical protein Thermo_01649 [Thermoplasmatales archaeon]